MPKAKRDSVREVPFVLQTILPGACSQVEVRGEHDAITRLWNPDVAFIRNRQALMTETARTLGLTTIPVEARGVDTLEQAFATMVRERAQAFVMQGDSVLFNYRGQIAEMALRNRLPAAAPQKEDADAGFLVTYVAEVGDLLSSVSRLCRQDIQGCEACRPAGRAADQVR